MTDGIQNNAELVEVLKQLLEKEEIALVKMAYRLAGMYRGGRGSGPMLPEYWLAQALGENFDRSILDKWKPEPYVPTISQKPISSSCEPNAHRS